MKSANREKLEQQGFCIIPNVIDRSMVEKLRQWSGKVLENVSENHRAQFKSQGCLADISDYPEFSEIIGHQALAALFDELDLGGYVFSSGSVISKPPASPALFWHNDWWGWDDPVSYTGRIPQVNMMLYLLPTTIENGCLRVIPGSHRRKHPIHEAPGSYDSAISKVEDPSHPLYQSWEGECAVEVQPGDVVVKDTRLLHGAYANNSNEHRTLVSLNFNPEFSSLPAGMQARIKSIFMREREFDGLAVPDDMHVVEWPEQQRSKIEHLFPQCADNAKPLNFNFSPNLELMNGAA